MILEHVALRQIMCINLMECGQFEGFLNSNQEKSVTIHKWR